MPRIAKGAIPSPNIWNTPQVYELENRAVDPDGVVNATLQAIHPFRGATVLDIGCGTGYHLPSYADDAAGVIGIEPHADLAALARRREPRATVHVASAHDLPLPDSSVDVAIARWAYFFGPGCEPGLRELSRVVRRGGTAFVVDLDATRGAFGRWFARTVPTYSAARVESFWSAQGWQRKDLDLRMVFQSRADLEAVMKIEFTAAVARAAISEISGLEVEYPNVLRWRTY
ncbi:class I SAM-dependent methyltransferase [Nonomuraea sp. NPDC050556]|uniref:class I SAM-dependent methyltransferase n=1 Tax=Nonomuraea sp. NPDC050556 TaxID=3364369 RepID=UPI0037908EEA